MIELLNRIRNIIVGDSNRQQIDSAKKYFVFVDQSSRLTYTESGTRLDNEKIVRELELVSAQVVGQFGADDIRRKSIVFDHKSDYKY